MSEPNEHNPSSASLSEAVTQLTKAWGKATVVRGGSGTLWAQFQGLAGRVEDIFAAAGASVDFASMAPQHLDGPPDMNIVSGRINTTVSFLAQGRPSAKEGLMDIEIRMEMQPEGAPPGIVNEAVFETIEKVIGDRLYEEGVFAQLIAHILRQSGRHRERFYAELAQMIADFVRAPDEAP